MKCIRQHTRHDVVIVIYTVLRESKCNYTRIYFWLIKLNCSLKKIKIKNHSIQPRPFEYKSCIDWFC